MKTKGKVVTTILLVIAVLMAAWALHEAFRIPGTNQTIQVHMLPPLPPDAGISEALRASRHPLIPGGAHAVNELLAAMRKNPALAAFYAQQGFRADCAQVQTLRNSTWALVSFRTDDGFAFTTKPVLLLAGEDLLVDCEGHIIRSVCGNIILQPEIAPQLSADSTQGGLLIPPGGDLPFTLPPTDVVPPQTPTPPPAGPQPTPPGPPYYPVPCCLIGFAPPPSGPPVATPEPPTWAILVVGWGVVLIAFRILRGPR